MCPVERWLSYREKRENRRRGCARASNHTFHPRGILLGGTMGIQHRLSFPFPHSPTWQVHAELLQICTDDHAAVSTLGGPGSKDPALGASQALSRMALKPQWALLTATLQFRFPACLYTLQAPSLYISYSSQMSEEVGSASLSSELLAGGGNWPMVVKMTYPQLCWDSRSG